MKNIKADNVKFNILGQNFSIRYNIGIYNPNNIEDKKIHNNLYTKDYFEENARLFLQKLLHINIIHRTDIYKEDRPDLISEDENIGIEVTRAINEQEGRSTALFQQHYPKENLEQHIKDRAKQLGVENNLKFIEGLATMSTRCDGSYVIKQTIDKIKEKLDKLNDIDLKNNLPWNLYPENSLFCYVPFMRGDIDKVNNKIIELNKNYKKTFDNIFCFMVQEIILYKNNTYKIIPINEYSSEIKELSTQYAIQKKSLK